MRQLVELDERSRCTQPGERDPIHALKILKNHVKGSVVILFFSEATRMYTVGKLMSLHESEGQFVTIASIFAVLRNAFLEVNGGHGEQMHAIFNGLLSPMDDPARVMIAQARPTPLGDRNGRGVPSSPTKDDLRRMLAEKDKLLADMGNQIAQDKANKDKNKRASTEAYNQHNLKRAANEAQEEGASSQGAPNAAGTARRTSKRLLASDQQCIRR